MEQVQLKSRVARQSDLRAIARLCRRAVSPRDYVLQILPETIQRKGLFLAYYGNELVGMTNFQECVDGSAWLSMARTDPSMRRKGVARFLQKQIADHAKRKRISALRLWTSSKNRPSIKAIRKGGFRQVCEAAHISYHSRSSRRNASAIRPLSRLTQAELESLLESRYLSEMNGYLAYQRHFVKASKPLLSLLLRRRELYRAGDAVFILTKPRRIFGELETNLALLTGPVTRSLRCSKQIANACGAPSVRAYIPYNRYRLATAKNLGFKREPWGRHCLVFEKTIS